MRTIRLLKRATKNFLQIKLLPVDICKISAKVKHLDLIDMAEGKMLYMQAHEEETKGNKEQVECLLKMASELTSKQPLPQTQTTHSSCSGGINL